MKIRKISTEDALFFCKRDEDQYFDRKSKEISGQKVQKIAVALANADGGEFVIGIKDEKEEPDFHKRWLGVDKIELFNPFLQALVDINPTIPMKYEAIQCNDFPGTVLLVYIDKSTKVHYTPDNCVYQRVGAQSLKISDPQKIIELSFSKGEASYEDKIINSILIDDIVDGTPIKDFLSEAYPKVDALDFISNTNLIDTSTWEPRICGLLLFHPYPHNVMPTRCSVKIVRYETKEDEPERDHLKDTITMEGSLYDLIHRTVNKITEIMSSISIWTIDGLKTMKYPPEAIWEVVVNAFIHRDYSISDDISIFLFDDRIEIKSPGKLPGNVTVDNILDSRLSRNPKIVRTLSRYKNPPNKDLGEGLNTTFQKMLDWKLKKPIIEERNNYVIVTLPHVPLAKPSELILEFLTRNSEITNKQAREITGIRSENSMKNEFYKLRDGGMIEMVPGKKGPLSAWRKMHL